MKKSVATVIILSIVTCGIYVLYWLYKTAQDLEAKSGAALTLPPIAHLLLSLFVNPVGYALFGYDCAKCFNKIRADRELPAKDDTVLLILLGVFIPIVAVAVIQDNINKLPE